MNCRSVFLAVLLCSAGPVAWAPADQVKTTDRMIGGSVTKVSAVEVVVDQNGRQQTIPADQVVYISFEGEPASVKTARAAVSGGRYEDALSSLAKVNSEDLKRKEVVQDVAFYKAYAAARLALVGQADVVAAGKQMNTFLVKHTDSFHFFDACELVGDLLMANGNYANAQIYYAKLGQAPWPGYKMRAAVATGRALLAEDKTAEAKKSFAAALAAQVTGPEADRLRLAATLGEARCLGAEKQTDQAIKQIEDVINAADPEDAELLGEAYNALGAAYREADRPKDALMAYLHVDILYFASAGQHVEALQNLVQLWNQLQMPERANEAARVLRDRYKRAPR